MRAAAEFGHLVHEIFGGQQQPFVRFSGVATEWDFVEAPSQLLESWAWDYGTLARFARRSDGRVRCASLCARAHERCV
jgi:thimet oligopeptidase